MRIFASIGLLSLTVSLSAADADPALATKAVAVLKASCIKCHGAEKQKGGLRLDSAEAMAKGGDNGKIFVPGKPDESGMIKAVRREGDPDYHMPPKEKDALSADQVAVLAAWVAAGAAWPSE